MSAAIEVCENCGRQIGRLETPRLHGQHVVCAECWQRLSPAVLPYESPRGASPPATRTESPPTNLPGAPATVDLREKYRDAIQPCPGCGLRLAPVKKARGSRAVLIVLLLLWILPGILYLIFYQGYVYVCPNCGMKRGDVA